MTQDTLSLPEARRITLAALGLARPRRASPVDARHIRGVIERLGLVQIDYVNVLVPAQFQVLFSRLGQYDRRRLHDVVYGRREFTEQWAHEASIVPMASWPLLQYRRDAAPPRPTWIGGFMKKNHRYVKDVLGEIQSRGPLGADDLPAPPDRAAKLNGSWIGTVQRAVLEALFARGVLASANRRANFVRTYDLAERIIPGEHHQRRINKHDAQRELLRRAAGSYGVATAADLADYYRMPVREARPRLAELVETGELRAVEVEGWRETAYLANDAKLPRRAESCALVSPFDPVVWYRRRAARLFDFDYRIEIFIPQAKRRWGYYVLPFLMGDRLVARLDLKAFRGAGELAVLAAYLEPGCQASVVADALADELILMAQWLGLTSVTVGRKGNLARQLGPAVRQRA